MRGLQKSNRVSWASDGNLCQVRLFLSEDNPSQVGLGAQDHLQAKASWMLHSSGMGSDDNLPPGFEDTSPSNQLENKISQIPLIKWRCPPRFALDINWQVVAGEESKELVIQNQREMRVLEAVYPRQSAIPSNPAVVVDMEGALNDDRSTVQIPITPIEEDGALDALPDPIPALNIPAPGTAAGSQSKAILAPTPSDIEKSTPGMALGLVPNVLSAASAASIDHELLIKILSDPKLVEKLVMDHGQATASDPPPAPVARTETNGPRNVVVGHVPANSQPMLPPLAPPGFPVPSAPSTGGSPVVKDLNYYKSLIQQHGGERQDGVRQSNHQNSPGNSNNSRPRDSKARVNKPCIYFNSSRGCRNGANCAYRHDGSVQQGAKRMKVDRDITGTQSCS